MESEAPDNKGQHVKKILILSSTGGYGHTAAAKTLINILPEGYAFKIIHPINELKLIGVPSGESFYNYFVSRNLHGCMNFVAKFVAPPILKLHTKKMEKLIKNHLINEQPDLLISLIPFVNYPCTEAARKLNIPYLLITTDNDLYNWVIGLEKMKHPRFSVTIGSDLQSTRLLLEKKGVTPDAIHTIGLPLRPQFFSEKTKDELRQSLGVKSGQKVILIIMGGVGGNNALRFAKKILKEQTNVFLIVCTGKNRSLQKKLANIHSQSSNSLKVVPFTEEIPDYMKASDLIITKPGPGTLNEAFEMKVPVLIDETNTSLYWEKSNIELIKKLGVGQSIKDLDDLSTILNICFDPFVREQMQHALMNIPSNQFCERITGIVENLCDSHWVSAAKAFN